MYHQLVELGEVPIAHYIHSWSACRPGVLTGTIKPPASQPVRDATVGSSLAASAPASQPGR